jgi:hypothetical protein
LGRGGGGPARIVGNTLKIRNYERLVQVTGGAPWYTVWRGNAWPIGH